MSERRLRHGERGQALTETVVFLPLFILALFGILWSVRTSVQYERTQLAVRYSGLISQQISPYTQYSLYAMYSSLGRNSVPAVTCIPPLVALLSDGLPYTSTQAATMSQPFWFPVGPKSSCVSAGIVGSPAGSMFYQDVVVIHQQPRIVSSIDVPTSLGNTLGKFTAMSAQQNFFKPIGIDAVVACFPSLNTALQSSLQPTTDRSPATSPVPMTSSVDAAPISGSAACTGAVRNGGGGNNDDGD